MTTPPTDNAGVRVFPPALYAAPLLSGVLLDRVWPLPIPARGVTAPLGAALLAAGVGLAAPGAASFRHSGTPLNPTRPAATLVTTGPYRLTRHPIYVGMATTYAGVTLLAGTWWPVAFLPLAVLAVDRLVIAREEPYLRRRFGSAYDEYCARVRRWL